MTGTWTEKVHSFVSEHFFQVIWAICVLTGGQKSARLALNCVCVFLWQKKYSKNKQNKDSKLDVLFLLRLVNENVLINEFNSITPIWNKESHMSLFIFRDAMLVPIINCATSIFAGFVIFSILGFMAHETGKSVEAVITQGGSWLNHYSW